eukprot:TRINITY_DN2340_c0_g2_i1.p1 TRINITY_DN2340_c0_g2~~TRINITY_DN2340_c0_g2_i1.p1  ORF type:complete len:213 (-),score=34.88 TRINITY_DN2340_c0_g2_i1:515-1096(-)
MASKRVEAFRAAIARSSSEFDAAEEAAMKASEVTTFSTLPATFMRCISGPAALQNTVDEAASTSSENGDSADDVNDNAGESSWSRQLSMHKNGPGALRASFCVVRNSVPPLETCDSDDEGHNFGGLVSLDAFMCSEQEPLMQAKHGPIGFGDRYVVPAPAMHGKMQQPKPTSRPSPTACAGGISRAAARNGGY